jgi:hypothetical protein
LESSKQLYEEAGKSSRSVLLTWQRRQGVVKNSILVDANRQVRCTILKFPEEMQLAAEFFMTIRGPLGDPDADLCH